MKFKGDEFMKNIEIEKEKAELKRQTDILDGQKNASTVKKQQVYGHEPVIVDIKPRSIQELNDIRLEEDSNNANKKKYLILSAAFIALFILTLVIIRLITNDSKDEMLFTDPQVEEISQDGILNSTDDYQTLIDKKAKETIQKKLDLERIVKEEIPLPNELKKKLTTKAKKPKSTDLFGMEHKKAILAKKKEIVKPNIVQQIEQEVFIEDIPIKKIISKKPEKKEITVVSKTGTYIQVGAFTKLPNKSLLLKISKYEYRYIIHKMTIKGTLYNKVLIGPYTNRASALQVIGKVQKDLNKPDAYIVRIK